MVLKRKRESLTLLILLIGIIVSLNYVGAITGKIGNGKMILDAEVGDTIDRTILVINDNNVSVNITLFASGDLVNNTEIIDKNFILQPGEQKKAEFIIKIKQPGTTNTRINVQFQPLNPDNPKESGIGLSAQIIVRAVGEGELVDEETSSDGTEETNSTIISRLTGSVIGNNKNFAIGLGISSLVLLIILIILLSIFSSKMAKNIKIKKGAKKNE